MNKYCSLNFPIFIPVYVFRKSTLLPAGVGGGGHFGPCHQTGSQNSRTLSPRVSKISDFSLMHLGHIVAKFQVFARGIAAVIFRTRGHEKHMNIFIFV